LPVLFCRPVLVVLFWLSSPFCSPCSPILAALSRPACMEVLSWQFCSVLTVTFRLSSPFCPLLDDPPLLPDPGSHVLPVQFYLYISVCSVLAVLSCSGFSFLAVLDFLFCPGCLRPGQKYKYTYKYVFVCKKRHNDVET
jgi:hypothetical protein